MPTKFQATKTFAHDQNFSRRQLLKFTAGLTGYCLVPQALGSTFPLDDDSANYQHTDTHRNTRYEHIEFRFVDSKSVPGMISLGQGTIVNHTARDIFINSIAPQTLTTDNGSYDIAAYLTDHPITLVSGQRQHFWVRPQTTKPAYGQKPTTHGGLEHAKAHREAVLAHIDNPAIGIAAKVQPVEFLVTTANT